MDSMNARVSTRDEFKEGMFIKLLSLSSKSSSSKRSVVVITLYFVCIVYLSFAYLKNFN
jgi:hypothetical protein